MYTIISHNTQKTYTITTPGEHVFYFENISADIQCIIDTPNAHVRIYGLYTAANDDRYTLRLHQVHRAPHSHSSAQIKSIVSDRARLHITSMISVTKDAHETDAHFTNNNLLLSPDASVTTVPQLEVIPHRVTCTHAATTAPLDRAQIHYMTTRGLPQKDAEKLLIEGFTHDITKNK
ncbi:MAG: hypothetical protein CR954_00170 [Candidatus Moraniibacteriota bacterium]|nr:MAG: hypothetical protein CR954_00170 [Candidatus Moranbacteria bacterium]